MPPLSIITNLFTSGHLNMYRRCQAARTLNTVFGLFPVLEEEFQLQFPASSAESSRTANHWMQLLCVGSLHTPSAWITDGSADSAEHLDP